MKFELQYLNKKTKSEKMSKQLPSFEIDGVGGGVDIAKDNTNGFYGGDESGNEFFMVNENEEENRRGASSRLLKTRTYSKSNYTLSTADQQELLSPSEHLDSYKNRFFSECNIDMLGVERAGSVRLGSSSNAPPSPRLSSRLTSHDDDIDGYVFLSLTMILSDSK